MKKNILETALINGYTQKTDERIAFIGAVDELSCHIMELYHFINEDYVKEKLISIIQNLSLIMGIVVGSNKVFDECILEQLLNQIKVYQKMRKNITSFLLPGQTLMASKIHIVRAITRRVELAYAKVYEKYTGDDNIFEYLNKLSSYFYELSFRYEKLKIENNN